MPSPDVAVVIVNWNVRDMLAACLESLQPAAAGLELDIVVVDNASSDGSADMVRRRFPHVRLIANRHNPGFAGGNNQAMRELGFQGPLTPALSPKGRGSNNQAMHDLGFQGSTSRSRPRYVLLLNPDTLVRERALAAMAHFMDRAPQAGVCGARLVYGDGSFQHSGFGFPGLAQIALDFWPVHGRLLDSRLNGRYPRSRYARGEPFEIGHPLGAALMARAETIAQVGLMDEGYYMYCEEIDWCWRIRRAGWKIYSVPQAEIVHYGGQSTAQARPEMIVALWRSRKRLYGKYYPAWKRRLAAWLVRAGARAQIRRVEAGPLADAYLQVLEMFKGE